MKEKDFVKQFMGRVVLGPELVKFDRWEGKTRITYLERGLIVGWAVGIRNVYDMTVESRWEDPTPQNTFGKHHRVALVATRPGRKPRYVLVDKLELAPDDVDPLTVNKAEHWSEGAREEMREIASQMPRDEKGRWVKS